MSATPVFAVTPRFASGVTVATLDTVRGSAGSATGKVTTTTLTPARWNLKVYAS